MGLLLLLLKGLLIVLLLPLLTKLAVCSEGFCKTQLRGGGYFADAEMR
jgi:hypothetical protein